MENQTETAGFCWSGEPRRSHRWWIATINSLLELRFCPCWAASAPFPLPYHTHRSRLQSWQCCTARQYSSEPTVGAWSWLVRASIGAHPGSNLHHPARSRRHPSRSRSRKTQGLDANLWIGEKSRIHKYLTQTNSLGQAHVVPVGSASSAGARALQWWGPHTS